MKEDSVEQKLLVFVEYLHENSPSYFAMNGYGDFVP